MTSYVKVERNELEHAVLRQQESNRKRLQYVDNFCWIRLQTHLYISEGLDIGKKKIINRQYLQTTGRLELSIELTITFIRTPLPPPPHFLSLSKKKKPIPIFISGRLMLKDKIPSVWFIMKIYFKKGTKQNTIQSLR